jgi:hypothetical protein
VSSWRLHVEKKRLKKGKQTTWREVLCVVWTRRLVHSDKHSELREKPLSFRLCRVLARWQPKAIAKNERV